MDRKYCGEKKKNLVTTISPSPTMFSKQISPRYPTVLTLSQASPCLMCLHYNLFENTVEKGEIVCNEQFLIFAQCFLPFRSKFKIYFFQFGRV